MNSKPQTLEHGGKGLSALRVPQEHVACWEPPIKDTNNYVISISQIYAKTTLGPRQWPYYLKNTSMIDWIKKMWHIYTMEYCAAIKKNVFMSFAGTWMKLETIILSKLTQEQKTKHCMFSLISGS